MIIRRATQVVAGTAMPRNATLWLPGAWSEGPCEAGIGQWRECFDRANILLGARASATGSHLPLEDAASLSAVAPFAPSRLSRFPSRKATVVPAEIYSALPY